MVRRNTSCARSVVARGVGVGAFLLPSLSDIIPVAMPKTHKKSSSSTRIGTVLKPKKENTLEVGLTWDTAVQRHLPPRSAAQREFFAAQVTPRSAEAQ